MSTAPSEAHRKLIDEIRVGDRPMRFDITDRQAARLIRDSEARAVKAAMSMKPEVIAYPALLKIAKAQRERVRVLEEALGRIEDAADKHSFGGDMLAWAGDVATAALATPANPPAATAEKEGSK